MPSRSATANESRVNRRVTASTRNGIPIQRGRPDLLLAMILGYTSRFSVPSSQFSVLSSQKSDRREVELSGTVDE
jgi:hypothetical protein